MILVKTQEDAKRLEQLVIQAELLLKGALGRMTVAAVGKEDLTEFRRECRIAAEVHGGLCTLIQEAETVEQALCEPKQS